MRKAPGDISCTQSTRATAPKSREVTVLEHGVITLPAFVLQVNLIALPPVNVRASTGGAPGASSFGNDKHVLDGGRMALLEAHGASIFSAIRELGGGVIVKSERQHSACIESDRRFLDFQQKPGCMMVIVVLNGVVIGDGGSLVGSMRLEDLESVEYLSPLDAGQRYGLDAAARGAIVLWTRGNGPHRSASRNGRDRD